MRLLVGEFSHESNCFCAGPTRLADFEALGLDVRHMQAVGFKGLGLHVRQALAGKIERFIPVDALGVTHPDVRKLGRFRRLRRPCWPFDDLPLSAWS